MIAGARGAKVPSFLSVAKDSLPGRMASSPNNKAGHIMRPHRPIEAISTADNTLAYQRLGPSGSSYRSDNMRRTPTCTKHNKNNEKWTLQLALHARRWEKN